MKLVLVLLLGSLAWAQDHPPTVHVVSVEKKPKLARVDADSGAVFVRGIWRPDYPNKRGTMIETDEELSCLPYGGKDLVGTEAFCLEASASSSYGMLNVSTTWLKVVEWSKTQIIAVNDSPICLTSQIIFDLRSHSVMSLDIKKAGVKGLFNSCDNVPDRETYYLQDEADYYQRKASLAAKQGKPTE